MSICGNWKLKDVETTFENLQKSTLLFRDISQSVTDLADLELLIELVPHLRMPSILLSLVDHNGTLCVAEYPLNGLVSRSNKEEEHLDLAFIRDVDQNLFEFKILHFVTDNSDIRR